jgi:signal transduction histidine kinase
VRSLVNTALNEVDAMARQYGVRISAEGIDGIVRGDADRIVQTLTNVLGNSVKFSPRGGTVTVSTSQRGEMVEFAIADHGRGIPADRLDRIFERFEQVDSSDSRVRGGTGLGLPISRDIITLHGGSIWVESELGEGSVFRFTLPGTVRQPRPGQLTDEELQQPVEGVVG